MSGTTNPMVDKKISLKTNGRMHQIIKKMIGNIPISGGWNVAAIPAKKEALKTVLLPSSFCRRK